MDRFLSITSSTPNKRICLENVDDPPPPAVDVPAPLPELKFQYLFDTVYKLVSINGDKIKASWYASLNQLLNQESNNTSSINTN